MPWVPAVSEEQAGPEVKPVYKFLQENWGFVPNYFLAGAVPWREARAFP